MTEDANKPRVYIETTIASLYHETRDDPETSARRGWTRNWWDNFRQDYHLVTSRATFDELEAGTYSHQEDALALIAGIPELDVIDDLADIIETYINSQLMPADPAGDALHLALASYYRCDFLLTWNCRHLANANKFARIRRLNTRLGLFVPSLVTPIELLGEGFDDTGSSD